MKLIVAPTARREIVDVWQYIARDSVDAADNWTDKLAIEFKKLRKYPHIGRVRWDAHPDLRAWPFGSYMIFYRVSEKALTVLRVMSGYRDITESEFGEL